MRKNQAPKDNFKKQQKILLVAAGVIVTLGIVFVGALLISSQPVRRGASEIDQLAKDMGRATEFIQILGAFDRDDGVEIIAYEASPEIGWTEVDKANMDRMLLMGMEFAAERGKGLNIYMLNPATLVGLDGEEVEVLYVTGTFVCGLTPMDDINWDFADRDTVNENCLVYPSNSYWGEAETILWPPAQ